MKESDIQKQKIQQLITINIDKVINTEKSTEVQEVVGNQDVQSDDASQIESRNAYSIKIKLDICCKLLTNDNIYYVN